MNIDNLKGKVILVGKEPNNGRLMISVVSNGQSKSSVIGALNSVPKSVSRCRPAENVAHCKIEVDFSGNLKVTNLKSQNVTYYNDTEIVSKNVVPNGMLELGKDRYPITVETIIATALAIVKKTGPQLPEKDYSIKHLKYVWDFYDNKKIQFQITERKFNAARSATGIITMLAIACGFILGHGPIYICLYVTAISISVVLTVIAYKKASTLPRQQKELEEDFQQRYVCPNPECHHFLGKQPYNILRQDKKCKYCGCKFTEK